jgi:hypothetical protein
VAEEVSNAGLIYAGMEEYANRVSFSPEQLVHYLMTASIISDRVEHRDMSADEVAEFPALRNLAPLHGADGNIPVWRRDHLRPEAGVTVGDGIMAAWRVADARA